MAMWRLVFMAMALGFWADFAAAQAPVQSVFSAPPQRPVPTLTVQHIALDLRFDMAKRQAHGTAMLTLIPPSGAESVALDAAHMRIDGVQVNGEPAAFDYARGDADDNLQIALPPSAKGLPREQALTVSISYATLHHNDGDPANIWGSNGKGLRFFGPTTSDPRKRVQIWASNEPFGARHWFPSRDRPDHRRTFELTATVDKPLSVISNGELLSVTDAPNNQRRFHYRLDQPQQNHRSSLVVGEFVALPPQAETARIQAHAYPDELEATADSTVRAAETIRFFEGLTGQPYPYKRFDQVFVQELPWGLHGTGLGVQSENMVDDFGVHVDFLYLWNGLQSEAAATQWFGGLIAPADWKEVWLSKAFARHLDGRFTAHKNGWHEYLLWLHAADHATLLSDLDSGTNQPVALGSIASTATESVANLTEQFVNGNAPYVRGSLVLHNLSKHVGEAAWQAVLRHHSAASAGKLVSTADFQAAVEHATHQAPGTMRWFFDQWVWGNDVPDWVLTEQRHADRVDLTLQQRQSPPFQGRVAIELIVQTPLGVQSRVIWKDISPSPLNSLSLLLQKEEQLLAVNFDFERSWIKRLKHERSSVEWFALLQHSSDVLAKQQAMGELAKLAKTDAALKSQLEAALVDIMLSQHGVNAYWRMRFIATNSLRSVLAPAKPTEAAQINPATRRGLLTVIQREGAWAKSSAIHVLGLARDPAYAPLYTSLLRDLSDRVVNAAAIALGRSRAPKAFDALQALPPHPSWKNQSLISALAGFKELGDVRAVPIALNALTELNAPRWTLGTPVWDYRLQAADALAALGASAQALPAIKHRLDASIAERDMHDVFSNVQVLGVLGDVATVPWLEAAKPSFVGNAAAIKVLDDAISTLKTRK